MAYAILRVAKLKTAGSAGGLNKHLTRTMEVPNADPELAKYNSRPIGTADLNKDIAKRLETSGVQLRGDSVRAVEFLLTASPEHFNYQKKINEKGEIQLSGNIENWKKFEQESIKWLCDRYGKENVVNVTVHKDEQTPHLHAVIVPIYEKNGENRLSAKEVLGNHIKMREMQGSFAEVHRDQGLKRGVEGSKMNHTDIQDYYSQVKAFKKAEPKNAITLNLPSPKIELEAPERDIIGRMKETPDDYIKRQQERLQNEIATFQRTISEKITEKLKEYQKPAIYAEGLKLEKTQVEGQMKGFQTQIDKLKVEKDHVEKQKDLGKSVIEAIAQGHITPGDLKNAKEKLPDAGNKREAQIRELLQKVGVEVKKEEIKQDKKRNTGISM